MKLKYESVDREDMTGVKLKCPECEWVMDYTRNKLEDFVDLNLGEKTMMNLWNKHVNKYQVTQTLRRIFITFCTPGSGSHPLGYRSRRLPHRKKSHNS